MSEVKISALLLMMLLTVTTTTAIASADSIPKKIRFNALASGPCFVMYGLGKEGTSPIPSEEIWYMGEGGGKAKIRGKAKDLQQETLWSPPDLLWGDGYNSTSINARGYVSVSWTEDEGTENEEKNWVLAVLYSTPSTSGFFIPNELLSIQLPGTEPGPEYDKFLRFEGIHVSGSEIKMIQGFSLYMTIPYTSIGWPGSGYLNAVGLGIPLGDENLIIYQLWWCSDGALTGGAVAEVLQWNVKA